MAALLLLNDTLYDALPYALLCLGFVWTAKYIRFPDLTCSGTFVLGGAVAAVAIVEHGCSPGLATVLAILGGAAGGLLTAAFYVGLRIDRILAGILSAFVLYSVNLLLVKPTLPYRDHATLLSAPEALDRTVQMPGLVVSWHPWVLLTIGGTVLAVKWLMDRFFASEMGLALRALEDENAGESALLRHGLSPGRYRVFALGVGNAIVALAGALESFKEGAANAHRGFDVLVTGLIAFLVGLEIHRLGRAAGRWAHSRCWRRLGVLLNIEFTTAAVLGAPTYYFLLAVSQRIDIDPSYARIALAALLALSVANVADILGSWRRRAKPSLQLQAGGPLLAASDLCFRYPTADTDTITGIQMAVGPGQLVRLHGSNGSGKTTTLRLLAGFLQCGEGGRIVYDGRDLTSRRSERLRRIAYVDQDAHRGVVGTLTTEENLALARAALRPSLWRAALRPVRKREVHTLATDHGRLPARVLQMPAAQLSGGQKQVVNLLTLLARRERPKLVLLDEPTNNLDTSNRERCHRIVKALRDEGVAMVLVSHADLADVQSDIEIHLDVGRREAAPGSAARSGAEADNAMPDRESRAAAVATASLGYDNVGHSSRDTRGGVRPAEDAIYGPDTA